MRLGAGEGTQRLSGPSRYLPEYVFSVNWCSTTRSRRIWTIFRRNLEYTTFTRAPLPLKVRRPNLCKRGGTSVGESRDKVLVNHMENQEQKGVNT